MTRKRTTVTTETDADREMQELDAFDRARLEFQGPTPIKVTILRYDEGTQRYLKRLDYNPDAIDAEFIRKKWGPGSYLLRFHDAEDPRKGWSQVIDIAPDESTERPAVSSSNDVYFQMLKEQNTTFKDQANTLMAGLLARSTDGGGGGSNAALVALIEGMQNQNNTILQAMLNRGDTSGMLFGVFEKALQLASDLKGESEGGWVNSIGRIARDLLPALQEFNKMRPTPVIHPGAVPGGPAAALPAGAPSKAAPAEAKPEAGPGFVSTAPIRAGDYLETALRQFAPEILKAAQQNEEPETVADGILQSIPPVLWPEFDSIAVDRVVSIEPQLEPHREWVSKIIDALKDRGELEDESAGGGVDT